MNKPCSYILSAKRCLIILFLFLLTGCGNVLDKRINVNNSKEDLADIRNNSKGLYTKQDIDQCSTLIYLCRIDGIKNMGATTYRGLLDSIKANRIRVGAKSHVIKTH